MERRTLRFKEDGTGLEYRQRVCKRKLLIIKKCKDMYDEYLFSDREAMLKLARLKFKAKVL